jgi:hypothetical protein
MEKVKVRCGKEQRNCELNWKTNWWRRVVATGVEQGQKLREARGGAWDYVSLRSSKHTSLDHTTINKNFKVDH